MGCNCLQKAVHMPRPHLVSYACLHLPTQILVRLRISLCFASNDRGRNMATVHTWKHEAIK